MAIIIPSKQIYDKDNEIIRNNLIDKVEIVTQTVTLTTSYDQEIAVITTDMGNEVYDTDYDYSYHSYNSTGNDFACFSHVQIIPIYVDLEFTIPKTDLPVDINEVDFEYTITGNIVRGTTSQALGFFVGSNNVAYQLDRDNITYLPSSTQSGQQYDVSLELKSLSNSVAYYFDGSTYSANASVNLNVSNNVISKSIVEEDDGYHVNIRLLAGITRISAGDSYTISPPQSIGEFYNTTLQGDYEQYTPTTITISFYGIYADVSTEDVALVYGNGKKSFSVDSNELMQTPASAYDDNAISKIANNILSYYKNGLQVITLVCAITDYYDEEGNLAITKDGSKSMIFRMHDEVIPYVYSINGDVPIALNNDNTPKVFKIIGTNIYYDGAVWQELTLKEKKTITT